MIAVDTNILVYAHRQDSPWYDVASKQIKELAEGRGAWAIPWPCLHEFLAVVSNPKIYSPPTPIMKAFNQIDVWLESPSLNLLTEGEGYWPELKLLLAQGQIAGPKVHDARIAAICRLHGVRELWTADRDFGRFANMRTKNPLVS